MSSFSQHEKHLNADGFSAFVDNAMSENERLEVIAHIADCEQCREIIVLLQEAGNTSDVLAPQTPAKRRWFVVHPFLGSATAALAAVLITSVAFVAQRHFGHNGQTASQAIVPSLSVANAPLPTPAGRTSGASPATQSSTAAPSTTKQSSPRTSKPQEPTPSYEAQAAAAADALHLNVPDDDADAFNTETGDDTFHGSQQWRSHPLPSKLPAIAVVTRVHYKLAADMNGSLFLSYDGGGHWRHIPKQWSGNIVRLATSSGPADHPQRAMPTVPAQRDRIPIPSASKSRFELTTDTGGVWISYDGTHWRPQ